MSVESINPRPVERVRPLPRMPMQAQIALHSYPPARCRHRPVTARLTLDEHSCLIALAAAEGRTPTAYVGKLVREHISQAVDHIARERLREEAPDLHP